MTVASPDARADKHRKAMAAKSRQQSKDVAEIGSPPDRDQKFWDRYRLDLHAFLAEVFPHSTGRSPFSEDHKRIIRLTEETILDGGLQLNEMFRGGAKSSITEGAAIWSAGYGHRAFFVPIGATDEAAQQSIDSIQMEFETNDLLMALFPAVCHAARALEGVAQRAGKQTIDGVLTNIEWTTARCVLPTYKGFEGSGAIIWPRSITAKGIRGMRFKRPDGVYQRPDFVMLDDFQTDESAQSPAQNRKLLKTIRRTILRLGGHDKPLACVCNATPIEPDDAVEQLVADRAWRSVKVPILKGYSKAHDTLWLEDYYNLRTNFREGDKGAMKNAHAEATAFYDAHRNEMDAGAEATWPTLYNEHEISAIQHAYNILIEIGPEAFEAECMLRPVREKTGLQRLTVDQICAKQSQYARGIVPPQCTLLTMFTDVHPSILYWMVWAWEPNRTGYLIDYGTFPDQKRRYFAHLNHPVRLQKIFPRCDDPSRVYQGLRAHLDGHDGLQHRGIMTREWMRTDGVPMGIGQSPVDANGREEDAIMRALVASPHKATLYPSFGKGVTCKQAPMHGWPQARKHPKDGPEWFTTKAAAGKPRGVMHDTNYWGAEFHRALALPDGSRGALYLYKAPAGDHRMVAEHWLSQPVREVTVESRTVYEFGEPNGDNHFYDTAVGCLVAASRGGATTMEAPPQPPRKRQRVKYAEGF